MTHTKGPMTFHESEEHNRYIVVKFEDGRELPEITLDVRYCGEENALHKAIRLDDQVMPLLKAAPELLEAARTIQAWSWTLPLAQREADVWKAIDRAIAKATGGA